MNVPIAAVLAFSSVQLPAETSRGKAKGLPVSSAYGRNPGGSMELRSQYTPQVNPFDQPFFTPFATLKNRPLFPQFAPAPRPA